MSLVVMVGVQGRKRLELLRDMAIGGLVAAVVVTLLTRWVSGQWPLVFPEAADSVEPVYTILRVGVVIAVIVTAAPHVVRRCFGWLVIVIAAITGAGLGLGLFSDTLGAIGIGLAAAGLVLVVFGSPRGYPRLSMVGAALDVYGLGATEISVAAREESGARRFTAVRDDGTPLLLKVYGRDAQAVARAWRSLWYRSSGPASYQKPPASGRA